jgi:hypothetical protein
MIEMIINPTCYVCDTIAGKYRRQMSDRYAIIKCANCGLVRISIFVYTLIYKESGDYP